MKAFFLFIALTFSLYANTFTVLTSSYYIDSKNAWDQSTAYSHKDDYTKLSTGDESLGFTKSTIWIYVKIQNTTPQRSHNIIQFSYPLHDAITVYSYKNKKLYDEYTTGDLTDFSTRKIDTNDFAIPYELEVNETKEILFKFNSESSLNIGMKFLKKDDYYAQKSDSRIFLGAYYGAVIIMLIYNFMLYFMIRERVYLDYVSFHFSYILLHLGLNGLAFQYLYPTFPTLNLYFIPILFPLANYLAIRFTLSFLGIEKYRPKLSWYLKILMNSFLIVMLLGFIFPYSLMMTINTILSLFSVFILFLVGIYIWFNVRTTSSVFYIIAWSFLLLGALLGELQNLGLLTMNYFTYYAAQIGAIIELCLLAFALAHRYNVIFVKLTDKEHDLRVFNRDLESKVRERTEDLDEQNKELLLQVNNKNILFRELYHRVKNNLQIVSSLLTLQGKRVEDGKSKDILNETTQRIQAMSMIHEKLYQANDLSVVNMQNYTEDLVTELQQGFKRKHLRFIIECEYIELNLEVAVPMGLIINELITNAIKYAFTDEDTDQVITIKMYTTNEYTFLLEIYDNGKGVNIKDIHSGFGFKLVQSLAKYQLKGNIESYDDEGLHHKITFPKGLLG